MTQFTTQFATITEAFQQAIQHTWLVDGNVAREHLRARNAKPSETEIRDALARERQQREAYERQTRERREADARAEVLLRRHLSPQQAEDLEKRACFYVTSIAPNGERRRYRINRGTHGNIQRVENDSILETLCVQPGGVPVGDSMLAQKLWLETDEEGIRRVANITRRR